MVNIDTETWKTFARNRPSWRKSTRGCSKIFESKCQHEEDLPRLATSTTHTRVLLMLTALHEYAGPLQPSQRLPSEVRRDDDPDDRMQVGTEDEIKSSRKVQCTQRWPFPERRFFYLLDWRSAAAKKNCHVSIFYSIAR